MYSELQEDTVGSPNENGGVDKGFLEEVTFELKHKGKKSQLRQKTRWKGTEKSHSGQ